MSLIFFFFFLIFSPWGGFGLVLVERERDVFFFLIFELVSWLCVCVYTGMESKGEVGVGEGGGSWEGGERDE